MEIWIGWIGFQNHSTTVVAGRRSAERRSADFAEVNNPRYANECTSRCSNFLCLPALLCFCSRPEFLPLRCLTRRSLRTTPLPPFRQEWVQPRTTKVLQSPNLRPIQPAPYSVQDS